MSCPCGNEAKYEACCEPYISGKEQAPTAEALMRARYTAYTKAEVSFLKESYHPDKRSDFDEASVRGWAKNSEWQGLEVLETVDGEVDDRDGQVVFIARYQADGEDEEHHERAFFQKGKKDGKWYFVDGVLPHDGQPMVRQGPKVGRNDPCPCGSGKKHKKCCGKN